SEGAPDPVGESEAGEADLVGGQGDRPLIPGARGRRATLGQPLPGKYPPLRDRGSFRRARRCAAARGTSPPRCSACIPSLRDGSASATSLPRRTFPAELL